MDIKLEDLFQVCDRCKGSGWIREGSSAPAGRVALSREGTCEACGGMKGRPTPAGQVILDFLEKSQSFHRFR